MHLNTNKDYLRLALAMIALVSLALGCGPKQLVGGEGSLEPAVFSPLTIADSSKIVTYPNGLQLYVAEYGPGDYPINGMHVQLHYQGVLADGTVFDDSYSRGEPLEIGIGNEEVIPGLEEALKKLRLGSKAIAVIPPGLAYGDGKGKNPLPPKIPANATLTFQLDLIGSF